MKLNRLYKLVALCACSLFLPFMSVAQVLWDTLPYKEYVDFKLLPLDKSIITTGILYDRVFPIADIERFQQQNQFSDTTSARHWVQAYYELYHSAFDNSGWISPDVLEAKLDTNRYVNKVPIGILNYRYNVMDSNAYVDNLLLRNVSLLQSPGFM